MTLKLRDVIRERVRLWRDGAKLLKRGVVDSPSHDLRRMINERVEAINLCADELEGDLAAASAPKEK